MADWPQSLKIAVRLMLDSRYAMWLGWGPDFTFFYNDAYAKMTLGPKHPWALGRPAREVWSEIWADIGPRAESVIGTGQATWDEGLLLFLERHEFPEETYHTFSYSPIPGDQGGIGGMLCVVTEDTERTLGERRLRTLRELAARTTDEAKSAEDACQTAARILAENQHDLPFVLIYLLDDDAKTSRLVGATGLPHGSPASPASIALTGSGINEGGWPLRAVLKSGHAEVVTELGKRFGLLRCGPWSEPTQQAVVVPMAKPGQTRPTGFIVAGVSPRLVFNDNYKGFLDLLAGHIATAIANARAYEEERRRAEALAELDRAKTAFFSNVSHEFRTPLTLMLGPVEDLLAKSHTDLPPAAAGQLEVVNRNGLRLLRLVNTLLDFSRIEAGRVRAVYQSTDLAAFSADLASVFRSTCERAGLRLVVDCPPLSQPVFVDREMWEKIVLNLLSNAFKFTFEGEITVSLRQTSNAAELRVRDTGTGIPAEEMPRLFERFHRVENARGRTHEGSGIGLALVQELVKLHGGSVTAESVIGKGTTFTVRMPLGSAHLPADRIGESRSLASTVTGASPYVEEALRWLPPEEKDESGRMKDEGGRMKDEIREDVVGFSVHPSSFILHPSQDDRPRLLVADDNADMRQYIIRLLAEHYRTEAVPDGEAALAAAQERLPDLILSDVMMPRLDGFGLLRKLRADPQTSSLPVIMLSARAGEESRVEGMEAGADDYLIKPFSARELLARVAAHLQMARMRREASESLRRSEERFQSFMRHSPMTAYIKDEEGRYFFVNRTLEEMFQRPLAEWVGKTDFDLFASEEAEQYQQNDRSVLASCTTAEYVETVTKGDGLHYFLSFKFPLQDDRGRWLLGGMSLDITEQKRTESFLAGQKRALEMVATDKPLREVLAAIVRTIEEQDPGLLCSILLLDDANKHVRLGAGPSLPEAYMQGLDGLVIEPPYFGPCGMALHGGREVIVPDIQADERWSAPWRELALGHGLRSCRSLPILATDGRVLAAFAIYRRQPSDFAQTHKELIQAATHLVGIAVERKRAEEELRKSEGRLRGMFQQSLAGIVLTDPAGRFTLANERYCEIVGRSTNELYTLRMQDITHPDDLRRNLPLFEKVVSDGTTFSFEKRYVRPDGSHVWVSNNVSMLRGGNGQADAVMCVSLDITDRKQMEEELRHVATELADANRRKDEFLATLAHELRNPLAPLRTGLQVMKLARNNETIEQSRAMMERQLVQMVRLIDDLLDLSRVSRGKITLQRERIELAKVIQQAVETSRPLIDTNRHDLAIHVPPHPIYVDADPIRLAQVFANLLNNAAKFTERCGRITLTVQRQGSDGVVSVRDTGVGIPANMLPKLFEMFTQVDRSLERSQGGLGIGLSLVKQLVEMHGGSVEARSDGHGRGSEFVVRLPVVLSLAGEARSEAADSGTARPARRRILVVDDNRDSALSLALMFQITGNETQTAHDGLEALARAEVFRPDVVLLDIGMPKLNGYDTARRMRQEEWGKNVVLVALTGWGQEEDRRQSMEAGFDSHMVKPVEPAALEKLLAELQASTRLNRRSAQPS